MAHYVICKYCSQKFNRDIEPFVRVGERRYAHKACAEKYESSLSKDERDYEALETYIKKLFNTDVISARIRKQIRDFREQYKYTFSGMLKTLYWWYEIQGHTTELAQKGIGIIPFVYEDACKYYYNVYLAKMVNEERKDFKPLVQEIEIGSPRVKTETPKLFNF